ncbi:MAG: 60S ribosomal protein L31 [Candidatus Diapherotrites archaeon]|nr:60S ribosomal protein L31 [Candidatus Diapherotrites archaeon]
MTDEKESKKEEVKAKEEQQKKKKKIEEKPKPKKMKETVHTVNLSDAWEKPRTKRARAAVQIIKRYLKKHTRKENVLISEQLNRLIWKSGIQNPPRKVKIKILEEEEKAIAEPA